MFYFVMELTRIISASEEIKIVGERYPVVLEAIVGK